MIKPRLFQFWDQDPPPDEVVHLLETWEQDPDFSYQRFNRASAHAYIHAHLGGQASAAFGKCAVPANTRRTSRFFHAKPWWAASAHKKLRSDPADFFSDIRCEHGPGETHLQGCLIVAFAAIRYLLFAHTTQHPLSLSSHGSCIILQATCALPRCVRRARCRSSARVT